MTIWPWVAGVGAGLGIVLLLRWRWSREPFLIAMLRDLVGAYARGMLRFRPPARDPLPPTGPVLLICNHVSGLDPFLLCLSTSRRVGFLISREYYDLWWCRWMFDLVGCIPVDEDAANVGATRAAIRGLEAGKVIATFPEGQIQRVGAPPRLSPRQLHRSPARIALAVGAPVVPARLTGPKTYGRSIWPPFLRPARARLTFGPPVTVADLRDRRDREAARAEAQARIDAAVAALTHALRTRLGQHG